MTEKLLEEMSPEEFEQLMDDFITREQTEVPISTFFKALALIDRERQAAARVIHLRTRVAGDRLVFFPPVGPEVSITVEGNEIVLEDGRRIVLELVSDRAVTA
jgi:hypothetical protein